MRPDPATLRDVQALARLFSRAARRSVRVPADLAPRVEGLLVARCLERIGLARRAGRAIAGADKVAEALAKGWGRDGVIVEASDAGSPARQVAEGVTVVRALTADELGVVFGRGRTVHALVTAGGHAEALKRAAARLEILRGRGENSPPESATRKNGRIEKHDDE